MRFGIHISVSGGLKKAVLRAAAIGCETIQIFSSNPMGWKIAPLNPEDAAEFAATAEEKDIWPVVLHTPYLINLAAPDDEILRKSRENLRAALQRAEALGAPYVVTHVGSHKGTGMEAGIAKVLESIEVVLGSVENEVVLLLENNPGSGSEIGCSFEEFAKILNALPEHESRLGVCLDTAHLWGAGYDIGTAEGAVATLEAFEAKVGLRWLYVIHANDSSTKLNSHHDVHQPPGQGLIGLEAFAALVNHPWLQDMPFILETPTQDMEKVAAELALVRSLVRSEK
jgi:deoxyribonuclease-4